MSSYFDEASLVMIPSGYKDQKVYSVKPLDGSGDLTFSRASSATRVASNGLIEKVRTNLALYSQDWTNWTLFQATATANTTANPLDGAVNADTLTISTSTTGVSYRSVATGTAVATFSVYLKAGTHNIAQIGFTDGVDYAVNVNLTLGTITGVSSGITGTITSVGSGWYRVTATRTISTTSTPNAFVNVIVGTVGSTIIVFGAQVELGDIATDYIATTSAAVSVGPVSGLPRLDYLNSTCPRLLLEPQRSNLATYSEQADQYTKAGATIGSNVAVSPDGYTNADSIIEDSANSPHAFYNFGLTTFSATAYTLSIFAKKGGRDWIRLSLYDGTAPSAYFNLNTGAIGTTSGVTAKIENYGSGWYRCSVTATMSAVSGGIAVYSASADGIDTYVGTNGLAATYFYGWQLELGAYATSYIPTLGAAVTRGADVCSKSGISSILPTQTGTLYVEFDWQKTPADVPVLSIHNNSTGLAWIQKINSTTTQGTYFASGYIGSINGTVSASAGIVKVAYAWTNGRQALYINGVQAGTATAAITDSNDFSIFEFNGFWGIQNIGTSIASALVFPTALSNSDLAALTA